MYIGEVAAIGSKATAVATGTAGRRRIKGPILRSDGEWPVRQVIWNMWNVRQQTLIERRSDMLTRYVKTKTARLYNHMTGKGQSMVLIYGDRVRVEGPHDEGSATRIPTTFRGRTGYMKQNQLHTGGPPMELYFIDVGQGDSTFIITPGRKKILIDGGVNRRALGFLIWMYRLDDPTNSVDIDLLVLTHADGDHLDGLVPIVTHPQINVQRIVHSGIATFRGGLHERRLGRLDPTRHFLLDWHDAISELAIGELSESFQDWRQAIVDEQCQYGVVDSTTGTIDVGDSEIELEVLGPHYEVLADGSARLPWFDSRGNSDSARDEYSHTINGHSVVLRLNHDDVSILLPGDLNIKGAEYLMDVSEIASRMSSHILKSPHHGSHEFHFPFFEAISPQLTVVSSGDGPDHGHPRANFLAAIGRASRSPKPLLFSTEIAATFVETGDELADEDPTSLEDLDFSLSAHNIVARKIFKQRLPGLINVRTDGHDIYAARRVSTGYWWESYGPMPAAPHPTVIS